MNTLRIIEVFYNTSINKNYFTNRDHLVFYNKKLYVQILTDTEDPYNRFIIDPHFRIKFEIGEPFIAWEKYGPQRMWFNQVRGSTRINPVFEYAIKHDCFREIFESREFLEIALDTKKCQTFFEDEWFIKAFEKLINYFDRITLGNRYTRISRDTNFMPSENFMTFKTLLKISKSFIGKSTVSCIKDKFDKAFDIFFDNVWNEYEHHNKLPF